MDTFNLGTIDERTLASLLEAVKQGPTTVTVNSPGGDIRSALSFVDNVKAGGLEGNLRFRVMNSGSATSFIVLSLSRAGRELLPEAVFSVHGGRIECEVPEIASQLESARRFYRLSLELLRAFLRPNRVSEFLATNTLVLTPEECTRAGLVPATTPDPGA